MWAASIAPDRFKAQVHISIHTHLSQNCVFTDPDQHTLCLATKDTTWRCAALAGVWGDSDWSFGPGNTRDVTMMGGRYILQSCMHYRVIRHDPVSSQEWALISMRHLRFTSQLRLYTAHARLVTPMSPGRLHESSPILMDPLPVNAARGFTVLDAS